MTMAAKVQTWKAWGIFDQDPAISLYAVRMTRHGAQDLADSLGDGDKIAPVTITLSPKKKARKAKP